MDRYDGAEILTVFRLRTLGGAALERDGVTLDTVGAQRKSLALLTLLAVSRSHGISRERLAAHLWPESDTERARGALKQALHVLRRQLGSGEAIVGTSELRLNPTYIESDVDAFLGALEAGDLDRAVDRYGGPFLDGFYLPGNREFEEWVSAQRDELARRYASALDRLASGAEAREDPATAIEWLRRLLTTDPFSVRMTLRLMRALDAAGERFAALRTAQVHEALLREELDSTPDPEVAALATQLREESVRPTSSREVPVPPPPAPAPPEDAHSVPSTSVESPSPGLREAPQPEAHKRTIRLGYSAVGLVVLFAAVLYIALFMANQRGPRTASSMGVSTEPSVAVLPFENLSGDSANDHISDGLTDGLTIALSRVQGLRVAPPTMTFALNRRGLDMGQIADTLGVASMVQGNLRRNGDRVQVKARLVDPQDRKVLWAGTYDRESREVLAVQEEIVRAVLGVLYPQRAVGGGLAQGSRQTSDPEAYDLYLRGRHSWRQRTRDGLQQAVVFFEEAIERDPSFATAHAALAATYVNLSNFGYRDVEEALARAKVAADRALVLDSSLPEAHAAKGFVLASRLEFDAAEAAFQRAIELNPSFTWAHHYYTLLLMMRGRTDDALEQNRQALTADPLSLPANATHGIILAQRGDLTGADRELQRALTLSPDLHLTLYYLGIVRAAQGRYADAGELLERAARQAPEFTGMPGARAVVLRRVGRSETADSLIAEVERQARLGDPRARVNLALAYAALGRVDAAFALFSQVKWDVPSLIELRADPLLEPLRSDPRYHGLLQNIGAQP